MRLFKTALAATAILAGASLTAIADDRMATALENTIAITGPDGTIQLKYHADNTVDIIGPDGSAGAGSWRIEGENLCTTATPPEGEPTETCNPMDGSLAVGESRQTKGPNGEDVTIAIVAGQ